MRMKPLPCLMVNDCEGHALKIFAGYKTIETRSHTRLDKYVGKEIGLIRTRAGRSPILLCTIRLGNRKTYRTSQEFYADYWEHLVGETSRYRWDGRTKYGYPVEVLQPMIAELAPQKGGNRTIRIVEIEEE